VSADLPELFESLSVDADRLLVLAPPGDLRATGDRRTRLRVLTVASAVVVVFAVLAGAGLALAGGRPGHSNGVGPGTIEPGGTSATPSVTPSPSPPPTGDPSVGPSAAPGVSSPASSSSGSPGAVAPGPCTSADLVFVQMTPDGAMGTLYQHYVVRNAGQRPCRLSGAPRIHYGQPSRTAPLDYATGGAVITIQPGGEANFTTENHGLSGAFPTGSPECRKSTVTYDRLTVVLSGATTLALGDATISVLCGKPTVHPWQKGSGL
jgi:hypothetical protein